MANQLRKLNDEGVIKFREYLDALRQGTLQAYPANLLDNEEFSDGLEFSVEVECLNFETRYDMGSYLVMLLEGHDDQGILGDIGIWSWLALFWFEQLCGRDSEGHPKPSKVYNYILSDRYNHRPRHSVRTTYMLVRDHGEKARVLLSKGPHQRGEIIEQFAARQFYLNCSGVVDALGQLYFDPEKRSFKRGAAGKGGGSSRRFITFLQQIEKTYDLYSISGEALLGMLPTEYGKFLPSE